MVLRNLRSQSNQKSNLNLNELNLKDLIPILLRSAALISSILTALLLTLIGWFIFYNSVGVKIGEIENVYLQYGHFRPPYSYIPLNPTGSYFASGQSYDITLDIIVPSSTRNVELGNFMVNLELRNSDGSPTLNISRPASLAYRSPISLALSALSPTSLFRSPDIQHISIPLVESVILKVSKSNPYLAYIELGRKDAHWTGGKWDGGGGELQVYTAKLRFDAHLSGLRYFLYHHSILAFLIFFPSFLFLELISALLIWTFFVIRSQPSSSSLLPSPFTRPPPPSPDNDVKVKLEPSLSTTSTTTFAEQDLIEAQLQREAQLTALANSGIRMREEESGSIIDSEEGWEESGTEIGESGSGSSNGSWENTTGEEIVGEGLGVKDEFDGSVSGGSATTRASTSTFGPSLASTSQSSSRSRATTASSS